MLMCNNKLETKENRICIKGKIYTQLRDFIEQKAGCKNNNSNKMRLYLKVLHHASNPNDFHKIK